MLDKVFIVQMSFIDYELLPKWSVFTWRKSSRTLAGCTRLFDFIAVNARVCDWTFIKILFNDHFIIIDNKFITNSTITDTTRN